MWVIFKCLLNSSVTNTGVGNGERVLGGECLTKCPAHACSWMLPSVQAKCRLLSLATAELPSISELQ